MRNAVLFATTLIAAVATGVAAHAGEPSGKGPFKMLVAPEQVFNLKAKAWKPVPNKDSFVLTHDDEFYLTAAKREDGMLMLLVRQPSTDKQGQFFYAGYYLKCGVMADVPFFTQNADELKGELANPQADDAEARMSFGEGTGMHDLYTLVCPS
ncbi:MULTISPECIES: hypothetical protein [unclassified Rhizobium]|jgi:hypothetical protein|uniref:hypothetical protein n=1 Tax=unclassified Rhizobium TaxID=2613769 RepID=UPI000646B958|nr:MULTISPECIES: hypothetical protein [unclassified Rhizobium]OJY68030.1 MAG: hypothetical protein BGP09_27630 [Rhizobium sp. 60-20]RKD40474.1 hypothetical protein BJ928_1246 [Rhizobium sp. WW_1]